MRVKECEAMAAKRGDADQSALTLFADELRAARDRAGLTQDELAARVNYSATLVAMIEGLKRVPQADFAARLDDVLGYPGTFARLQERLRVLPFAASFRPFAAFEESATALRTFEHTLVPGLFQTEDYARAVLGTSPNTSADELDDRVAARLARQVILDRDSPPMMWVVLDEAVLHREVGSAKVMRDQLGHLAGMSDRPNIAIQIVPYSAGAHVGLQGAFVIADFEDAPPVAFLATATDGQTVEEPSAVARVALTFDTLRTEALPRRASMQMIMKVAEEQWT
jgi:transcriptional regulator with XRE-family HTH domain